MHPQTLTDPEFDRFTVLLAGGARASAADALAASLGTGWRAVPVADAPGEVDLVPPAGRALEVSEAWEKASELAERSDVVDVEPQFDVGWLEEDSAETMEPFGGEGSFDQADLDWAPRLVNAYGAWKYSREEGKPEKGAGVYIGHPDSGIIEHPELGENVLYDEGYDFVDSGPLDRSSEDGQHGLSTASVIISPDGRSEARSITGIAPKAKLVPFRVTRRHLFGRIPSPVLWWSGVRRLRDAVRIAAKRRVHVISISLGWLFSRSLRRALRYAIRSGVIVVAAAGNHTGRLVVWPGRYPEVICLAGCTPSRQTWSGSARGSAVDAMGPAKGVWRACAENHIDQSNGTSHATATAAGIAALWLSHHGPANLRRWYPGSDLQEAFRTVLKRSSHPLPEAGGGWGAGIVDAKCCLQQGLPERAVATTFAAASPEPRGVDAVASTFEDEPPSGEAERIAHALGVPADRLADAVEGHEDEVRFHLLTNPTLRAHASGEEPDVRVLGPAPAVTWSPALRRAIEGARS